MEPGIKFKTVEEYFYTLTEDKQRILEALRKTIKEAAPQAKELISYNMPAFKLHGVLVYYAAQKGHIGFYPTSHPIEVFKKELASYKCSKGAIQFPLDKPVPLGLIAEIVRFRVQSDIANAMKKVKKQKKIVAGTFRNSRYPGNLISPACSEFTFHFVLSKKILNFRKNYSD